MWSQSLLKWFASKSIKNALSPVIILASVLTVTPFKFKVQKGQSKTSFSIPYVIWFLLAKAVYFASFIVTVIYNPTNLSPNINMSILGVAEKFQIYTGFFSLVYLMVSAVINKDDLAKMFEIQDDVYKLFKSLERKPLYYQLKFKLFLLTLAYFSMYTTFSTLDVLFKSSSSGWAFYTMTSTLYSPVVQETATLVVFTAFVYVITLNLALLNEEMMKISFNQETTLNNLDNTKGSVDMWKMTNLQARDALLLEKLNLLWNIYIKICDCSFVICRYFSGKILAILTMSFLSVLLNFFFLLSSMFKLLNSDLIEGRVFLFAIIQFIFNSMNIIVIIYVCNLCEQRVRKINLFAKTTL